MTPVVRKALGGVVCVVVAAGAVFAVRAADEPDTAPLVATTSTALTPAPTPSVTETPTESPTPTVTGPGPLSVEATMAAAPRAGATYVAAEIAVELSSVCEGASLALSAATPVYASLQSARSPLQYLDAALAVYDDPDSATRAYEQLVTSVEACPLDRTVTPTPTPSGTPSSVLVTGQRVEAAIGTQPALQWIQLQTVNDPPTQLRTAVTVTVVENVLLVVSVDQDSETASADEVAAASLLQAGHISERLAAAA